MKTRICIRGCTEFSKLHKFPMKDKEPEKRARWLRAFDLSDTHGMHLFVCSNHFSHNMYLTSHLIKQAVPDINLEEDYFNNVTEEYLDSDYDDENEDEIGEEETLNESTSLGKLPVRKLPVRKLPVRKLPTFVNIATSNGVSENPTHKSVGNLACEEIDAVAAKQFITVETQTVETQTAATSPLPNMANAKTFTMENDVKQNHKAVVGRMVQTGKFIRDKSPERIRLRGKISDLRKDLCKRTRQITLLENALRLQRLLNQKFKKNGESVKESEKHKEQVIETIMDYTVNTSKRKKSQRKANGATIDEENEVNKKQTWKFVCVKHPEGYAECMNQEHQYRPD